MEPPVHITSSLSFTEDVKLGKYSVKKGDQFFLNMWALHHKDEFWINQEKFIPERFDPTSKYYLTPSG